MAHKPRFKIQQQKCLNFYFFLNYSSTIIKYRRKFFIFWLSIYPIIQKYLDGVLTWHQSRLICSQSWWTFEIPEENFTWVNSKFRMDRWAKKKNQTRSWSKRERKSTTGIQNPKFCTRPRLWLIIYDLPTVYSESDNASQL